jgi:hypothetical protein
MSTHSAVGLRPTAAPDAGNGPGPAGRPLAHMCRRGWAGGPGHSPDTTAIEKGMCQPHHHSPSSTPVSDRLPARVHKYLDETRVVDAKEGACEAE